MTTLSGYFLKIICYTVQLTTPIAQLTHTQLTKKAWNKSGGGTFILYRFCATIIRAIMLFTSFFSASFLSLQYPVW